MKRDKEIEKKSLHTEKIFERLNFRYSRSFSGLSYPCEVFSFFFFQYTVSRHRVVP